MEREEYLAHVGKGHLQGGRSGRYPWGSGAKNGKAPLGDGKRNKNKDDDNPFTKSGKAFKSSVNALGEAVDIMWQPKGKADKLSQYRTRDIEEMNRRARAVEEYYGHYPTRAQRGKDITLGILAGIGSLGMATLSGIAIVSTLKGMKS